MLNIIAGSKKFFAAWVFAAIILRLIFIFRFPGVTTDSFVYGDIAKNWLHGTYGVTSGGEVLPTYIRLPGYPAFLAGIFFIFGSEHYRAVLVVQMFVDIASCFLIANCALRLFGTKASKTAFLLACLCPFTANYSAAALTETLEIFFTALALNFTVKGFQKIEQNSAGDLSSWVACALSTAAAMLLRPDGGILLAAIESFFFYLWLRRKISTLEFAKNASMVAVICCAAFLPWTIRNWEVMHTFQPLAPRYANEENEFVPTGFNRWVKTWIADYVSVEEIYWAIPGQQVDVANLPNRACDSPRECLETAQIFDEYNASLHISPEIDARFEELATARIHRGRLRYYAWLPGLRMADMWLRPRTEMLPSDTRWWRFDDEPEWSVLAVGLGAVGLIYVFAAAVGGWRVRAIRSSGFLIWFVVLRTLFLSTLENPEPRYTLECYPVVIIFAAVAFRGALQENDAESRLSKGRVGHTKAGSNVL